jgi:hypothetical protein
MPPREPRVSRDPESPVPNREPVRMPTDAGTRALGQVAYEAYALAVGGKAVNGDTIPAWDATHERVRRGWAAAADAVRRNLAT